MAAREVCDSPTHTVRYEDLVAEPGETLRSVFAFAGLDWTDAALDPVGAAKARGVTATQSYAQVCEPLYSRSIGRWTRDRRQREPPLPILALWIERWGYEPIG